ncbi:MAG TPA: TetR/AcrR family transcriptional regulator [Symbiobacteriaceae bacterium]
MAVRSGDKYEAILDAAQKVIAREGYHRARIAHIAAEAGVAAGTVYLYFRDKPDLLLSLFRNRLGRLVENARRSLSDAPNPEEKLRRFIGHHLRSLAARQDLAVVTQIEMRQADFRVQRQISEVMKAYFQVIDEIIAEGQATGYIRRCVDARQIRNMIYGTLDQTVTAWVLSGFKFDLVAMAEPTFELITRGACGGNQGGVGANGDSGAA